MLYLLCDFYRQLRLWTKTREKRLLSYTRTGTDDKSYPEIKKYKKDTPYKLRYLNPKDTILDT